MYIYLFMGGGLMQFVNYGAQDIYLDGNPQITYFKFTYSRYGDLPLDEIIVEIKDVEIKKGEYCIISLDEFVNNDLIQICYNCKKMFKDDIINQHLVNHHNCPYCTLAWKANKHKVKLIEQ